ncbi:MAG: hypothetical protein LBJ23_06355 [Tannerella sp.]|jgi:hypothetical protein|nr:hypothetical protein [Tannerella sp.]
MNSKMREKNEFTVYGEKALEDKTVFYWSQNRNRLSEAERDIHYMYVHKQETEKLFANPERFENGFILKYDMELFTESLLAVAVSEGEDGKLPTDVLFEVIYGIRKYTYSPVLQKYTVWRLKRSICIDKDCNGAELESYVGLFNYYLKLNSLILSAKQDITDTDFACRVLNTKEISSALISAVLTIDTEENKDADILSNLFKKITVEEKYGSIVAQIFVNTYFSEFNYIPYEFIAKYSSDEEILILNEAHAVSKDISGFLKIAESKGISPKIIGLYIHVSTSVNELYDIMKDTTQPPNCRLTALKTLSAIPYSVTMIRSISGKGEETADSETILDSSLRKDLSDLGEKLINSIPDSGTDVDRDEFFNSKEFEILYTAAILEAGRNHGDSKLIDSLRRLQYAFGNKSTVEISVRTGENGENEIFSLPVDNPAKYANILRIIAKKIINKTNEMA